MSVSFRGVVVAMVTPFRDGRVDEVALRRQIDFLVAEGVQSILPCGTTGESPTLSHDEHNKVVELTVEAVSGRVPVLAGAGSNSTVEAVSMAKHAKSSGADGLLLVSPYYNKPTQEGLYRHFMTVAEAAGLPVILYNIPGRCAVNILPETTARLAQSPLFVGVKEATGDLNQMIRTIEICPPDFLVTSGDDGLTLPLLAVGGGGVISVAANIIPGPLVAMWRAWEEGQTQKAKELFFKMLPWFKALFLETNPIPIKYALSLTGRMTGDLRLPMVTASSPVQERLKALAEEWGLIPS
ncbi:MAG: 4-hydroxy-tetrahydrodipicolinate synthase [Deltaproteobacteria bacterium]|jgi:4-hydroxy-tetrahydrodipicolinate synthase|nr:4-hydroxy-tetrahydrodipicolinate synthase [Deltaproteobacteria bacterium]